MTYTPPADTTSPTVTITSPTSGSTYSTSSSTIDLGGMDRAELEGYLDRHPGSVVLLHSQHTDEYFAPDDNTWREAVVRDIWI